MVRGKPLWPRRQEAYLAQIALFIARSTGNNDIDFQDVDLYRHRVPEVEPTTDDAAFELGAMAGVGVVRIGSTPATKEPE